MMMQSPSSCLWFGTGEMTKTLWPYIFSERLAVRAFVDEREKARDGTYQGCPVINLADVRQWEFDAFLLGARVSEETAARIVAAGVPREKIVSLDVESLLWKTAAHTGAVTFEECVRLLSERYGAISRLIDLERLCRSNWLRPYRNGWRILRALCTDRRTGKFIFEITPEKLFLAKILWRSSVSYSHMLDIALDNCFYDFYNGIYVDVGASHPVEQSATWTLYDEKNWSGVNIDPRSDQIELYQDCRPRDSSYAVAVSNKRGRATFYEKAGASTLNLNNARRLGDDKFTKNEVETLLLDDLLERHNFKEIHLLKIDSEQHEKEVLQGINLHKYRPWLIVVESTLPFTDIPCFENWEYILHDAGYIFLSSQAINRLYCLPEKKNFFSDNLKKNPFAPAIYYDVLHDLYVKLTAHARG